MDFRFHFIDTNVLKMKNKQNSAEKNKQMKVKA